MNALEKNAAVITAILSKLLEVGINNDFISDSDFGLDHELESTVKPCVEWLGNEGIVNWRSTAHTMNTNTWIGLSLTSRGIAMMGARFSVEGKEVTVAEYVSDPKPLGGSYSAIGDFLGSALGGFTKSITS